jgi:hypothetical protein
MITTNFRLMKTQIDLGSYHTTFFPVPPTRGRKSGRVNGDRPDSPRGSTELIVAGRISARSPARHDHSGLPASLEDWLVGKGALEICLQGWNGTEDGSHAWVVMAKPAARAKMLPATSLRPQTVL